MKTTTVNIISRWNADKILFSAEIDAALPLIGRVKAALVLAVQSGADLSEANLSGANLRGADLSGADLLCLGQRSDGYWFYAQPTEDGIKIKAGCRYFLMSEARAHWTRIRAGTALGAETMAMLDYAETLAAIRWPTAVEAARGAK